MLEFLKAEVSFFEEKLNRFLKQQKESALFEPTSYLLEPYGKFLRPSITLLACQIAGGDIGQGFPGALAVELIHSASLSQDDLIDKDEFRRGRPTLHKAFGEDLALLTGGQLFSIAFKYISEANMLDLIRDMSEVIKDMYEGEALELLLRDKIDATIEEVLASVQLKTARLFEFAANAGAKLAKAQEDIHNALITYGQNVGMLFQLRDDWLDLYGESKQLGKPIGTDLQMGQKSIMFSYTYHNGSESDRKLLQKIHETHKFDIPQVKKLFTQSGAEQFLFDKQQFYLEEALKSLDFLQNNSNVEKLKKIAVFAGERSR
ncbi:MAG: polyprenyl synthetase family protein [Candidatus Ranarchaeia archaeon]|jgi:geranylgeranyl diphosphate synthase type I